MTTRLIFNGVEYPSPDAMPPEVRRVYDRAMAQLPDADHNGIPDLLEGRPASGELIGVRHTTITINGRSYDSVDEMPESVRRLYDAAMSQLSQPGAASGTGSGAAGGGHPSVTIRQVVTRASGKATDGATRVPQPPMSLGRLLLALVVAGMVLLYFLLRSMRH